MNKEQFNSLDILDQIEYINNKLGNNNNITSVCKEIGVGRSTIRDRFKKLKYTYSKEQNKYVYNDCITDVSYKNKVQDNGCNTSVIESDTVAEIITKSDEEIKNNLLDLVSNYDVLKEIIELHRRNTSVMKQQLVIDLEESESKLTTIRINSKILDQFNKFCNSNKQYKKVDLVSQAMKEFIEKYN